MKTKSASIALSFLGLLILLAAGCMVDGFTLSNGMSDKTLAEWWCPVVYQDVADGLSNNPDNFRRDFLTNVDFDNDFNAWNNKESLEGHAYPLKGFAYYDVVETVTHYFVEYSFFHPDDWNTFGATNHENDQENMRILVEKDGSTYGRFLAADFNAHGFMNSHSNGEVTAGAQSIRGRAEFEDEAGSISSSFSETFHHIRVYIEPQKHGPTSCVDGGGLGFTNVVECNPTGGTDKIIYRVIQDGTPEDAQEPSVEVIDQQKIEHTGLVLLPGYSNYWLRRYDIGTGKLWDKNTKYVPKRNQDSDPGNNLAIGPNTCMGTEFAGDEGGGGGLPPWGFQATGVNRGDWLIDAAYAASVEYTFPGETLPGYLDYLTNPYLDELLDPVDNGRNGACGGTTPCGVLAQDPGDVRSSGLILWMLLLALGPLGLIGILKARRVIQVRHRP
jgi:hypothetical protein